MFDRLGRGVCGNPALEPLYSSQISCLVEDALMAVAGLYPTRTSSNSKI